MSGELCDQENDSQESRESPQFRTFEPACILNTRAELQHDLPLSENLRFFAIKIQSFWRGECSRASTKKLINKLYLRRRIVQELVETEQNYIRDLSIMSSDFRTHLLTNAIITFEQAEIIFSNVDELRRLNELFFANIFSNAAKYTHYKVIFKEVCQEISFFKIYFDYLRNFTLAMSTVEHLGATNKRFSEWSAAIRRCETYKRLTLQDYLVKPLQRLPKYVLIMKEIKKRTPQGHPDQKNIWNTLLAFEKVNASNNEQLNRIVNNLKLHELETTLNLSNSIAEPGIQFILEEPVTVLTPSNQQIDCTLYLLNCSIVVSHKNAKAEKLLAFVPFKNGAAHIMENQDQYFYKNCFTVQNDEGDSCTFICQNQQQKFSLIQKILNQVVISEKRSLEKLQAIFGSHKDSQYYRKMNRLDLLPEVTILGTEERNDLMFKYTIYIVEVRIRSVKQKIFVRFSEILALQSFIQHVFPQMDIKQTLLKTTWLLNHKPIKIQERKMSLQRFIKEILSKRQIMEKGQIVLLKLGLPQDFYTLPSKFKETDDFFKKSTLSQRSTSSHNQFSFRKKVDQNKVHQGETTPIAGKLLSGKPKICRMSLFQYPSEETNSKQERSERVEARVERKPTIQDVLQANQINLGHFARFSEVLDVQDRAKLKISVYVPWVEFQVGVRKLQLKMNTTSRVESLTRVVSRELKLRNFKDFRLVLQRQFATRTLDDDELLQKVIFQMKSARSRLMFKKIIFVDAELEQIEIRKDCIRLKIIASQVIYDTSKDKFLLSYSQFLKLSVLVGIIQRFVHVSHEGENWNQSPKIDDRLAESTMRLVVNQYTSFYDGRKTWKQDYKKLYLKTLGMISQIVRENKNVVKERDMDLSEDELLNWTSTVQLAAGTIINEMKDDNFYGSVSFLVQMSEEMRELLETEVDDDDKLDNRNCWLVVKYNLVSLYSTSLKKKIFEFKQEEAYRIQTFSSSILLYLRGKGLESIKLKTAASYNIRELMLYYKNYLELSKKLKESTQFNDSLIDLVKSQRESEGELERERQSFQVQPFSLGRRNSNANIRAAEQGNDQKDHGSSICSENIKTTQFEHREIPPSQFQAKEDQQRSKPAELLPKSDV